MASKLLHFVDIFGIPAFLNFSGKEKSSSQFGGVCSILFSLFAIWAIYTGGVELISRDSPQTVVSEIYSQDPREYIISPSTFPLGFYIEGPDSTNYLQYIDPRIYNPVVKLVSRYPDGSETYEDIATEPCTSKHFGDTYSAFSALFLDISFCLAKDSISIKGGEKNPVFRTLTVWIYQCDNVATNGGCASDEEMDSLLNGGWINFFYGNMVVDPSNYDEPDRQYRDIYYVAMSTTDLKSIVIQLRHLNVITDSGWIVEDWSTAGYAKVDNIAETFENREKNDASTPLIKTEFAISRLETNYTRSYKKIQMVLAEVAGLINTGLFCLLIATSGYLKLKVRETMMNEIFDVNLDYKPPKKKKKVKTQEDKKELTTTLQGLEQFKDNSSPTMVQRTKSDSEGPESKTIQNLPVPKKLGILTPIFGAKSPIIKNNLFPIDKKIATLSAKSSQSRMSRAHNSRKVSPEGQTPSLLDDSLISSSRELVNKPLEEHIDKSPDNSFNLLTVEELQRSKMRNRNVVLGSEREKGPEIEINGESEVEMKDGRDNKEPECSVIIAGLALDEEKGEQNKVETKEDHDNSPAKQVGLGIKGEDRQEKVERAEKDREPSWKKTEEKSKKISLSFWEYLLSFVYKPKRLRQKLKLLEEGVKNIDLGLDVVHMLKKMRDIDTMKALIFKTDQLILLNNIPKPEIRVENTEQGGSKTTVARDLVMIENLPEKLRNKEEVVDLYEKLKEKEGKTDVDKKLEEIFYDGLYGDDKEEEGAM